MLANRHTLLSIDGSIVGEDWGEVRDLTKADALQFCAISPSPRSIAERNLPAYSAWPSATACSRLASVRSNVVSNQDPTSQGSKARMLKPEDVRRARQ